MAQFDSAQLGSAQLDSEQSLSDLTSWVDGCLGPGVRTGGLALFRERTWASVWSAPTVAGRVWLKVCPPGTAHELGACALLARVAPECVLVPLGLDVAHGRILLPDAGPSLREQHTGPALTDAVAQALRVYGRLQRTLVAHADELLALGVPDMRPSVLPRRFDEAVAAVTPWVEARASDEQRRAFERVRGLRDRYSAACAELAGSPVPVTLDHGDLHTANMLAPADAPRFYDWGDSSVGAAFGFDLLDGRADGAGVATAADAADVPAWRVAYLEAFADLAPPVELLRLRALGARVGLVPRALVWQQALGPNPLDHRYAAEPAMHLLRLLSQVAERPAP